MRVLLLVFSYLALAWGATSERVTYEGYKVYEIHPDSLQQVNFLKSLEDELNIDFWTISKLANRPAVALVEPENQEKFEIKMLGENIKWNILIEDVPSVLEQEQVNQRLAPSVDKGKISFIAYYKYSEIVTYIAQIAADNNNIVTESSIGLSHDRTEIKIVNICKNACSSKTKIFIECGIHAREWIAPAMCLYIIQELVENPDNAALIENVDWHIVPVLNVDGYEYTHSPSGSRYWRKTRSVLSGTICKGADGNRNFEEKWDPAGQNECSETYAGTAGNSEVEIEAIVKAVGDLNMESNIKLYLAIHSYGMYILHPQAWTNEPAQNKDQLIAVGNRVADAIGRYAGAKYTVESFHDALYPATGTSMDWAASKQGVDLSFTIELPGGGTHGFDLPTDRIDPVVKETFEGIKEFHKIVEENYVKK